MTRSSTDQPFTDHIGPTGLQTRGTVLIVAGRGESRTTYQRLGQRLAADSYRVRVLSAPDIEPADLGGSLNRLASSLTEAVAGIDADGPVRPLVLLGSDTGAAALAALASGSLTPASTDAAWWPDALILAGLPGGGLRQSGGWHEELDARTQCPAHRGVLTEDPAFRRGTLIAEVPAALLDALYGSAADLPHFFLVGDADPLADREALDRAAKDLPAARLIVVRGAFHDVLNDLQHRSVAAEIVLLLESLRGQPPLQPIVTGGVSTW